MNGRLLRALARVRRARSRAAVRSAGARLLSIVVCAFAGFMIVTGALNSHGSDLRPNRNTDLAGLVRAEAQRNAAISERLKALRAEVESISRADRGSPVDEAELARAAALAGRAAVKGPAVKVTLTDAPADVQPAGVAGDLLVVHQQDIQAVMNALWAGGAEAMTIQGQRVVSRTGIKCVGNTVVVHGVPYAPPYVVIALGDVNKLEAALASSTQLRIYQQYVDAYGLGYAQQRLDEVTLPAFAGSDSLVATQR